MPSTDLPKIAVAETLAQNIAALDAAKLITGETMYIDGGYHIID